MFNLILGYNSRMTVSTPGKMAPFIQDKMAATSRDKMAAFSLDLQPLTEPAFKTPRGLCNFYILKLQTYLKPEVRYSNNNKNVRFY